MEKKLKLDQLRLTDISSGMVLPFDIYDRNSVLLMRRGSIFANPDLLRRTLLYAEVKELAAARNPAAARATKDGANPRPNPASVFERVRNARSHLETLLLDPAACPQFQRAVLDIAGEIQGICKSDADAAVASIIVDRTSRYPIRHSVDTALLTELMLMHIGSDAERRSALCAALTMNIAMIRLQEILYHQSEALRSEQQAAIDAHPLAGVEMLRSHGVTDDIWLAAVGQHHERLDGKGYPLGLAAGQISRESQAITIAERYCSMVSERGYRAAMLPSLVLKGLFMQTEALNPSLVESLVKQVGIYPPGSYVRLANGGIAIVLKRTTRAHQPLVQLLTDAHGRAPGKTLMRDSSDPAFQPVAAIAPSNIAVEHDPTNCWTRPG